MIYFFFTKYFRAIHHTKYIIQGYVYVHNEWITAHISVESSVKKYYVIDELPTEYQLAALELLLTL